MEVEIIIAINVSKWTKKNIKKVIADIQTPAINIRWGRYFVEPIALCQYTSSSRD